MNLCINVKIFKCLRPCGVSWTKRPLDYVPFIAAQMTMTTRMNIIVMAPGLSAFDFPLQRLCA